MPKVFAYETREEFFELAVRGDVCQRRLSWR